MQQTLFQPMPKHINDVDFNLIDPNENTKIYQYFINQHPIELNQIDNLTLLKSGNKLLLVDHSSKLIRYFVQWREVWHNLVGSNCISQVAVWRDDLYTPEGYPKQIFLNYLLNITGVMITDIQQTSDGKRFWLNRIRDTFNMDLFLYYVNLMQDGKNPPCIMRLHDIKQVDNILQSGKLWGNDPKFESRKLIITNKLLKETT